MMLATEVGPEELVSSLNSIVYILVVLLRSGGMRFVILGSWVRLGIARQSVERSSSVRRQNIRTTALGRAAPFETEGA